MMGRLIEMKRVGGVWALLLALILCCCTVNVDAVLEINDPYAVCDANNTCGHGTCVASSCECANLWSKSTDFVEFEDCSLSIIAMYILWGLNLVALGWTYFKSTYMILIRIEIFLETRRSRKGYGLRQNKGLLSVLVYFGISTPFHFIMAIANLVNPTIRIGFDVLPTLCFFVAKMAFYYPSFLVQTTMFEATLKHDREQQHLVKINTFIQGLVSTSSVLVGTFGFITLGAYQNDRMKQIVVMRAYYFCQSLTLIFNAVSTWILKRTVNKALDRARDISAGDNRSKDIRAKINELQGTVIKQGMAQGLVYLIFGAVPFLINKHDYFLPISWLAMPILGKQLAHQIRTDKNAKTVMQRLGLKRTGTGPSSSSAQDNKQGSTVNKATGPFSGNHQLVSTSNNKIVNSALESTNPSFTPSSFVGGSKKLLTATGEKQGSSFLSDGAAMEELLDPSHPLHEQFTAFVEKRHAQNEMALLSLCFKYRAAPDSKERAKIGKQVMKDFIEDDAPLAVDIPHEQKEILQSIAKRKQWVATTLDPLRRMLVFDLKGNFLGKFEKHLESQAQSQSQMDADA